VLLLLVLVLVVAMLLLPLLAALRIENSILRLHCCCASLAATLSLQA
jgi:hypothetical protein